MVKPSEVKSRAKKLEEVNFNFRTYLKGRADDDELDAQFLRLHHELFEGYDCCKCNNCCREYTILVKADEVPPIAGFLNMTDDDFIAEYLIENESADEDEGEYQFKASPCEFLDENGRCRIQECKPSVCKGFPYTDKPDRLSSMYSILESAEVCPVVFEILERLKEIYRFRDRGKRR